MPGGQKRTMPNQPKGPEGRRKEKKRGNRTERKISESRAQELQQKLADIAASLNAVDGEINAAFKKYPDHPNMIRLRSVKDQILGKAFQSSRASLDYLRKPENFASVQKFVQQAEKSAPNILKTIKNLEGNLRAKGVAQGKRSPSDASFLKTRQEAGAREKAKSRQDRIEAGKSPEKENYEVWHSTNFSIEKNTDYLNVRRKEMATARDSRQRLSDIKTRLAKNKNRQKRVAAELKGVAQFFKDTNLRASFVAELQRDKDSRKAKENELVELEKNATGFGRSLYNRFFDTNGAQSERLETEKINRLKGDIKRLDNSIKKKEKDLKKIEQLEAEKATLKTQIEKDEKMLPMLEAKVNFQTDAAALFDNVQNFSSAHETIRKKELMPMINAMTDNQKAALKRRGYPRLAADPDLFPEALRQRYNVIHKKVDLMKEKMEEASIAFHNFYEANNLGNPQSEYLPRRVVKAKLIRPGETRVDLAETRVDLAGTRVDTPVDEGTGVFSKAIPLPNQPLSRPEKADSGEMPASVEAQAKDSVSEQGKNQEKLDERLKQAEKVLSDIRSTFNKLPGIATNPQIQERIIKVTTPASSESKTEHRLNSLEARIAVLIEAIATIQRSLESGEYNQRLSELGDTLAKAEATQASTEESKPERSKVDFSDIPEVPVVNETPISIEQSVSLEELESSEAIFETIKDSIDPNDYRNINVMFAAMRKGAEGGVGKTVTGYTKRISAFRSVIDRITTNLPKIQEQLKEQDKGLADYVAELYLHKEEQILKQEIEEAQTESAPLPNFEGITLPDLPEAFEMKPSYPESFAEGEDSSIDTQLDKFEDYLRETSKQRGYSNEDYKKFESEFDVDSYNIPEDELLEGIMDDFLDAKTDDDRERLIREGLAILDYFDADSEPSPPLTAKELKDIGFENTDKKSQNQFKDNKSYEAYLLAGGKATLSNNAQEQLDKQFENATGGFGEFTQGKLSEIREKRHQTSSQQEKRKLDIQARELLSWSEDVMAQIDPLDESINEGSPSRETIASEKPDKQYLSNDEYTAQLKKPRLVGPKGKKKRRTIQDSFSQASANKLDEELQASGSNVQDFVNNQLTSLREEINTTANKNRRGEINKKGRELLAWQMEIQSQQENKAKTETMSKTLSAEAPPKTKWKDDLYQSLAPTYKETYGKDLRWGDLTRLDRFKKIVSLFDGAEDLEPSSDEYKALVSKRDEMVSEQIKYMKEMPKKLAERMKRLMESRENISLSKARDVFKRSTDPSITAIRDEYSKLESENPIGMQDMQDTFLRRSGIIGQFLSEFPINKLESATSVKNLDNLFGAMKAKADELESRMMTSVQVAEQNIKPTSPTNPEVTNSAASETEQTPEKPRTGLELLLDQDMPSYIEYEGMSKSDARKENSRAARKFFSRPNVQKIHEAAGITYKPREFNKKDTTFMIIFNAIKGARDRKSLEEAIANGNAFMQDLYEKLIPKSTSETGEKAPSGPPKKIERPQEVTDYIKERKPKTGRPALRDLYTSLGITENENPRHKQDLDDLSILRRTFLDSISVDDAKSAMIAYEKKLSEIKDAIDKTKTETNLTTAEKAEKVEKLITTIQDQFEFWNIGSDEFDFTKIEDAMQKVKNKRRSSSSEMNTLIGVLVNEVTSSQMSKLTNQNAIDAIDALVKELRTLGNQDIDAAI